MSIRGVDGQLMISRSADIAKEVSSAQRKTELSQDFLAIQGKIMAERDGQSVGGAIEVQAAEVRLEKDAEGGDSYTSQDGKEQKKKDGQDPDPPTVPGEVHIIDIKI